MNRAPTLERVAHRMARACWRRAIGEKFCAEHEEALEFFEGPLTLTPLETAFFDEAHKILVSAALEGEAQ